jgi:hypothetical protein
MKHCHQRINFVAQTNILLTLPWCLTYPTHHRRTELSDLVANYNSCVIGYRVEHNSHVIYENDAPKKIFSPKCVTEKR